MSTTYRNGFHDPHNAIYGPAVYSTEVEPRHYRGLLIFRRHAQHFDVVAAGVCVGQYAGLSGAKSLIDLIRDHPSDFWAERALRHLGFAALPPETVIEHSEQAA